MKVVGIIWLFDKEEKDKNSEESMKSKRLPFRKVFEQMINEGSFYLITTSIKKSERRRNMFRPGDRVKWIETGKIGVVDKQFIDGYVSLIFTDGRTAELDASSLQKIKSVPKKAGKKSLNVKEIFLQELKRAGLKPVRLGADILGVEAKKTSLKKKPHSITI